MFLIHNNIRVEGKECLDVKMYESLSRNEDKLISHTRIFRDDTGRMTENIIYRRTSAGAGR
ncbi:MAG: hypothetical protein JXR25_11285 [Pontiellaceae bacterium]|nr:hypothetical protein [Pontiellaceae bacterium]MBN2785397.1 hypothetical protein [Pontiellaceae bacterium]